MPTDKQIREQAERLVRNEVFCNLTYLLAPLDQAYGTDFRHNDLSELCEQAFEVFAPVLVEMESDEDEPYERQVFEAWSISNWLGDELEKRGERVTRDLANHNVWSRCTTGQAIALDHVIEQIAAGVLGRKNYHTNEG